MGPESATKGVIVSFVVPKKAPEVCHLTKMLPKSLPFNKAVSLSRRESSGGYGMAGGMELHFLGL